MQNNYPTLQEVEAADRVKLCYWHRFLRSPKTEEEVAINTLMYKRWEEVGGFTPEISKQLGWKTPFLLLAFFILSSCVPAPAQKITIFYVSPVQICAGDTLKVWFTWDGVPGGYQFNMKGDTINQIWSVGSNVFAGLPKSVIGSDTVYLIKFRTPIWWPNGWAQVSSDWQTNWPVLFNCVLSGILTSLLNEQDVEPKYYDLNGRITEKLFNTVLVERRGTAVRKVVFTQ